MNPIERAVRRVDRAQQRSRTAGFVFGVAKKFGDDRGPSLAALLAYYGFLSIFPLLLIFTTVLGFLGSAKSEHSVVVSTLRQFPVFGQQLGRDAPHPLTGSALGLTFGLVSLLYGATGAAQAGQHAMAQVWNVPGVIRPGFFPRMGRAVALFAMLGVGVTLTAAVSGIATASGRPWPFHVAVVAAEILLDVGLFVGGFRLLTPRSVAASDLVPGAVAGGVGYAALLTVGTGLVQHQLRHAQALYGPFAFVLGLIGWLYLVAQLTLYAAEMNVVRVRSLWPRSIVQPPLTPADETVLADIARQEERRPEERVEVRFPGAGA